MTAHVPPQVVQCAIQDWSANFSGRRGADLRCTFPDSWNDLGAETSQKLTLASGADGLVTVPALALKESLRVVRHTNKFGRAYSDKY